MVDIEIRDALPHEVPVAAAVLSRGMRDNPLHLSVFGPEPEERQRKLEQFFSHPLGVDAPRPLGRHSAWDRRGRMRYGRAWKLSADFFPKFEYCSETRATLWRGFYITGS